MAESTGLPYALEEALLTVATRRDHRLTPALTERLLEIAQGLSNREIAERHKLTLPTVKTEASAVLQTLGLRSREVLVQLAKVMDHKYQDGADRQALHDWLLEALLLHE